MLSEASHMLEMEKSPKSELIRFSLSHNGLYSCDAYWPTFMCETLNIQASKNDFYSTIINDGARSSCVADTNIMRSVFNEVRISRSSVGVLRP